MDILKLDIPVWRIVRTDPDRTTQPKHQQAGCDVIVLWTEGSPVSEQNLPSVWIYCVHNDASVPPAALEQVLVLVVSRMKGLVEESPGQFLLAVNLQSTACSHSDELPPKIRVFFIVVVQSDWSMRRVEEWSHGNSVSVFKLKIQKSLCSSLNFTFQTGRWWGCLYKDNLDFRYATLLWFRLEYVSSGGEWVGWYQQSPVFLHRREKEAEEGSSPVPWYHPQTGSLGVHTRTSVNPEPNPVEKRFINLLNKHLTFRNINNCLDCFNFC